MSTRQPLPPVAPGLGPFGSSLGFVRDPLQTVVEGWRERGDVVRFRLSPLPISIFLVAHPGHVQHVLQTGHRNYRKVPSQNTRVKDVLGDGLFTSDGDLWMQQRKMMQVPFHREHLAGIASVMTDATESMLRDWRWRAEAGAPIDVAAEMTRLTPVILVRALFGNSAEAIATELIEALACVDEHMNRLQQTYFVAPAWVPAPITPGYVAARRTLDGLVYQLIRDRRNGSGAHGPDLLSMMVQLRARGSDAAMSDEQLRDEVVTLLLGDRVTAPALAWTWYLLSKHAYVDATLRAELDEVLGGRTPTVHDLPSLRYTSMVVAEVLRLYPPAWLMARSAIADDEIGGYRIPAGSRVLVSPYVTHRHPAVWDDAERFDPERFDGERSVVRHRFAYFPFGGGPRQCIANNLALMELQLIVATVAQRFAMQLATDRPLAYQVQPLLAPRGALPMRLRARVPREILSGAVTQ